MLINKLKMNYFTIIFLKCINIEFIFTIIFYRDVVTYHLHLVFWFTKTIFNIFFQGISKISTSYSRHQEFLKKHHPS